MAIATAVMTRLFVPFPNKRPAVEFDLHQVNTHAALSTAVSTVVPSCFPCENLAMLRTIMVVSLRMMMHSWRIACWPPGVGHLVLAAWWH